MGGEQQLKWRYFGYIGLRIFFQACKLLADDYEQVRSAAVQLIWVLSQLYPERYVLYSNYPSPEGFVLISRRSSC